MSDELEMMTMYYADSLFWVLPRLIAIVQNGTEYPSAHVFSQCITSLASHISCRPIEPTPDLK